MAGNVESDSGFFVLVERAGALNNNEAARAGQSRFGRLDGVDSYSALVEASVTGVRFFGVGKRGEPFAFFKAVL